MSKAFDTYPDFQARRKAYEGLPVEDVIARTVILEMMLRKSELNNELSEQDSLRDKLTGVYNRAGLQLMYQRFQSNDHRRTTDAPKPDIAMYCDVDNFKPVNDTHGHDAGDDLITQTARILTVGLRENDIVGRLGGDEFVAFLPETTLDDASEIADRLRLRMSSVSVGEIKPTLSIGLAEIDHDHNLGFGEMLKPADNAMYAAKHSGGNATALVTRGQITVISR